MGPTGNWQKLSNAARQRGRAALAGYCHILMEQALIRLALARLRAALPWRALFANESLIIGELVLETALSGRLMSLQNLSDPRLSALHAWLAGLGMALSSLLVVLNALRLSAAIHPLEII